MRDCPSPSEGRERLEGDLETLSRRARRTGLRLLDRESPEDLLRAGTSFGGPELSESYLSGLRLLVRGDLERESAESLGRGLLARFLDRSSGFPFSLILLSPRLPWLTIPLPLPCAINIAFGAVGAPGITGGGTCSVISPVVPRPCLEL